MSDESRDRSTLREPILGPGLAARRLRVERGDVAWLRYLLEGYEGLASLHGDGTGVITLLVPEPLLGELDALLDDLGGELAIERL